MTHREFEGWDEYNRRLTVATATGNPDWAQLPQSRRVMQGEDRKLFFTGYECKRGHVSPRNVHGDCTLCHVMRLDKRRANAV